MAFPINPNPASSTPPALVYDGSCGFCSRSVRSILRHERRHDLLFVTRDSELGQAIASHHMDWNRVQSMLWVEGRSRIRRIRRGDESRRLYRRLVGATGQFLPRSFRRTSGTGIYKIIAKHRRRLSPNPARLPASQP